MRPDGALGGALLAAGLIACAPGAAQARCDDCPTPTVLQFDFARNVPDPPNVRGPEPADWLLLFFADDFANGELFNLNRQCIDFRDGDMTVTGMIRQGKHVSSPPPAGRIDAGDYLFTGDVSRDGEGYRASLVLETPYSRQKVLSASGSFTISEEVKIPPDSDYAKEIIANGDSYADGTAGPPMVPKEFFGPDWSDVIKRLVRENFTLLLPKIREFERRLRDADPRYAIDLLGGAGWSWSRRGFAVARSHLFHLHPSGWDSGAMDSPETEEGTTTDLHARVRTVITPVGSLGDAAPPP